MDNIQQAKELGWRYNRGNMELPLSCQLCGSCCEIKYKIKAEQLSTMQVDIQQLTINKKNDMWEKIRENCKLLKG